MEEYLDIYDDHKQKTGEVVLRQKAKELPQGKHILIATLIIRNDENKIMMQLTSKSKDSVIALPGGHVTHNENSKQAVIREVYEEQGILINEKDITLVGERLHNNAVFFDVYYLKANFKKEDMKLQQEEVEDVIWMTPDEISLAYEQNKVRQTSYDSIVNFLNSK